MLRSSAKNHKAVTVCVDPSRYGEIIADMNQVAEGVKTSAVVMELAERYGIEMPIAQEVHGVLYDGRTAEDAYAGLTRRIPGAEYDAN